MMITKLVEKKKIKAHQYWPDSGEDMKVGTVLDIGGGCKVEHVQTSYTGAYFIRSVKNKQENCVMQRYFRIFLIYLADGNNRQVIQLHTENWPELEAPEDPR